MYCIFKAFLGPFYLLSPVSCQTDNRLALSLCELAFPFSFLLAVTHSSPSLLLVLLCLLLQILLLSLRCLFPNVFFAKRSNFIKIGRVLLIGYISDAHNVYRQVTFEPSGPSLSLRNHQTK